MTAVCDCGTPWTFLLPFSVSYVSFNKNVKKKKGHFEIIERGVWSGIQCLQKQFSHFSRNNQISWLNVPKMDQPESDKFCKLSLSLSESLSFYPHINMARLLSSYKLFALTLLEKYRTGGNRT